MDSTGKGVRRAGRLWQRGRRRLLGGFLAVACGTGLFAQDLTSQDVDALPTSVPNAVVKYGTGSLQYGELRMPTNTFWKLVPVVMVIHGGCWKAGFATLTNTAPLATELTKHGIASWNIEYRQVGDEGGGWPGTFLDWADALDYLRVLAKDAPIDVNRAGVIGHSAGAHAALWLAARPRLPTSSEIRRAHPLRVTAAVALDGPGDLPTFIGTDAWVCGDPVVVNLMGGTPAQQPERYAQASPQGLLPFGVRQVLVSAGVLTYSRALQYQRAAIEKGDDVQVLLPPAPGHFNIIAPGHPSWESIRPVVVRVLAQEPPARPQRREGPIEPQGRF